jgi:hypothetical protein
MMKRKIWTGLGIAAALAGGPLVAQETGEAGEAGTAAPAKQAAESGEGGEGAAVSPATADAENFHGATGQRDFPFAKALSKVMAGEGGEGGIGLSQTGPNFVIPALTAKQLRVALVGNTIRKDQAVAMYFAPNGRVEGWKRDWAKADMSKCPTKLGDSHEIEGGECWTATVNPIVGPYEIRDNAVCMPAYSGKAADGRGCYHIGFAMKHVIIGDGKRMYGSGKDLVPGRELAAFLPRLH